MPSRPLRLLLVEDNVTDALLVENSLEEMAGDATLRHVQRLSEAEAALREELFDVILLDLGLPDGQGLDNLARMGAAAPDIPVIVLTGLSDEKTALEAIERGAADYLIKGQTEPALLERATRYAIQRKKSEIDRVELARAQAGQREAEAANRAKDEFLATLSHELRTPLNAILGWANLLRTGGLDEETQNQALITIERNARVQAQLIEDLLDVSRIITGNLSLQKDSVPLAETTRRAADTLAPVITAKRVVLDLDLDEKVCVRGDFIRLQQVVWNLISNAVKFSPEGASVAIKLRSQNNEAILTIQDRGVGIAPEFLPHVFERFRQADGSTTRRHSGLGLGLAIVRTLVELHGGRVQADSAGKDQGATFSVFLPLFQERAVLTGLRNESSITVPEVQKGQISLAGLRILAVDDQNDARQFVRLALESAGANVEVVGSGQEALECLARVAPDVLVCDVGMPEMDGYSLMRHLRRQTNWADLPALALTGYARAEERELARAAGFQEFLPKPVPVEKLLESVARLGRGNST